MAFIPDAVSSSFLQHAVAATQNNLEKLAGALWPALLQLAQAAHHREDQQNCRTPMEETLQMHDALHLRGIPTAREQKAGPPDTFKR